MLAAPLLISGSVAQMSAVDLATYTNPEAIAISQDPLGKQGVRRLGASLVNDAGNPVGVINVWARELFGGSLAIAFLNTGAKKANIVCDINCIGAFAVGASTLLTCTHRACV